VLLRFRAHHLKNCGTSRGLSTEQLLKIRLLEEKQAEERVALGLPALPQKREEADRSSTKRVKSAVAKLAKVCYSSFRK
jgi:hypothetical protein